jgi:hypothetical protein
MGKLVIVWTVYKGMGKCIILIWGALISDCMDSENLVFARVAAKRALDSDHQNVRICSYQLVMLIKAKGVRKRKRKR